GADRAGPGWRRPVAGSDRLPSGSQRPGDRCGARRTWCGRTWGPPSWSGHHDYGRFPCNFKGKIAQDVAPCEASEYSCRSIAKGLTARIAGLLSKTCLADQLGRKHPKRVVIVLGVMKHRLSAAEVDPLIIFARDTDQVADARGTLGDQR